MVMLPLEDLYKGILLHNECSAPAIPKEANSNKSQEMCRTMNYEPIMYTCTYILCEFVNVAAEEKNESVALLCMLTDYQTKVIILRLHSSYGEK